MKLVTISRNEACSIKVLVICSGLRSFVEEAARSCDKEVAGFLIGSLDARVARVEAVVVGCNVALNPGREFIVDARSTFEAIRVAESSRLSIIGVFHTHPGGAAGLSPRDRDGMEAWPVVWLVAGVDGLHAYTPCNSVRIVVEDYVCRIIVPRECRVC